MINDWVELFLIATGAAAVVILPVLIVVVGLCWSGLAWKSDVIHKWIEPTSALLAGIPLVLFGGLIHQFTPHVFSLAVIFFSLLAGVSVFQLLVNAAFAARSLIYYSCLANGLSPKRALWHGVLIPLSSSALDIFRLHLPHAVLAVLLSQWLKSVGIGSDLKHAMFSADASRWSVSVGIAGVLFALDAILARWLVAPITRATFAGVAQRSLHTMPFSGANVGFGRETKQKGILARYLLPRLSALGVFFVGWILLAQVIGIPSVFKGPMNAAQAFFEEPSSNLIPACVHTLMATVEGAILGLLLGASVGTIGYYCAILATDLAPHLRLFPRFVKAVISAFIFFIQSVPILVWLPIMVKLFGEAHIGVVIAAVVVGARVFQYVVRADSFLPRTLVDSILTNGVGLWRRFLKVDRHSVMRSILLGIDGALPLAISGVILGEYFASATGLGGGAFREMAQHKEVPQIVILFCAVISMATREILLAATKRLVT